MFGVALNRGSLEQINPVLLTFVSIFSTLYLSGPIAL